MEQFERFEIPWPQLKQKYYGQDVVIQYGSDYIDFSRRAMDLSDFSDPEKAYQKMLDIQADPDCILYPRVEEIFYRKDLPNQVIVDGEVQGFDQEYRLMMISPAHFLYHSSPDDKGFAYACTEYGFAIPLDDFREAHDTDPASFVKGDHIALYGSLVRTIVTDEKGPTFVVFTIDHIVMAVHNNMPLKTEEEWKAENMICCLCTEYKTCGHQNCHLPEAERNRLRDTITDILTSTAYPLSAEMKAERKSIADALNTLKDSLPEHSSKKKMYS
jgi:hypothetical protein